MEFNGEIIEKYLKGRFSLQDKSIVDEYFKDVQYTYALNKILKGYWDGAFVGNNKCYKGDNNNLGHVLDKINHDILLQSTPRISKLKKIWQYYSKIAALIFLPVIIFSICHYFNHHSNGLTSSWVEVHSPYGARTQFSLPDGSVGWLNSGSILKYPAQFNSSRNVSLKGEAYFKVAKNTHSPFIVNAKEVEVKVLGTEFNVVAYDNDSITEVVVASGKVEVTAKSGKLKKELLPTERFVLNSPNKKCHKTTVDVQNFISWKDGKLVFANDNLIEVARKVSRYYDVDFDINKNVDTGQLFRAVLEGESLEELMRYMKMTMPIDFTIKEREQNQDGTLSKRKVTINNAM